jgi:hypothetical protein
MELEDLFSAFLLLFLVMSCLISGLQMIKSVFQDVIGELSITKSSQPNSVMDLQFLKENKKKL